MLLSGSNRGIRLSPLTWENDESFDKMTIIINKKRPGEIRLDGETKR